MPKPDIDAPTQRILSVIEVISARGPITLVDLCAQLPISRAAIWRALDTLRVTGWVRMRAGDKAFELRFETIDRLSRGHRSLPEVEQIFPILEQLTGFGPVHVDLGGFVDRGRFRILESTRKSNSEPLTDLSLVDEDIAIAAQLTVPPPNLVLHLRAFMDSAADDERRIITSGEHGRKVARLRDAGFFWGEDRSSVAIALPDYPGFALRAELWRLNRADLTRFEAQVQAFLDARNKGALIVEQSAPIYAFKSKPSPDKKT